MKIYILLLNLFIIIFLTSCSTTKMTTNRTPAQQIKKFNNKHSNDINDEYLLFLPKNYEKGAKSWPLMIFLHGAGERGNDIQLVKKHGPPKIVQNDPTFPFILVSPQCEKEKRWNPSDIKIFYDEVISKYNVDTSQIYLTGLSMGGFGTWDTAIKYPELFAAIAPVCGGGNPAEACRIKNIPIWVFHGAKDNVVPIERSKEMVEALRKCGGNPKFTIYPDAMHDSWTETYNNPELYKWFLDHKK